MIPKARLISLTAAGALAAALTLSSATQLRAQDASRKLTAIDEFQIPCNASKPSGSSSVFCSV